MSLGAAEMPTDTNGQGKTMEDLFIEAKNKGIALAAAAGNGSAQTEDVVSQEYPASSSHVLGVTSAHHQDPSERSCYANQGDIAAYGGTPAMGFVDELTESVTFATSGEDCNTGKLFECDVFTPHCIIGQKSDGSFAFIMGTSFASPQGAAILALTLEHQPSMDIASLYQQIRCGSQNPGGDIGAGVIKKQLGAYDASTGQCD